MRVPYYFRPILVLVAAAVTFFASIYVVSASEISYSDVVPTQATDWTSVLEIPAFNPALGQLQSVEILMEGFVRGDVAVENTGPNAAEIATTHVVTLELQLLDASKLITSPTASRVEIIPGYDGVLDFEGDSGRTVILSATELITRLLTSPADLAAYTGSGILHFPTTATGDSNVQGPGNLSAVLRSQASSAVLTIIYRYQGPGIKIQKLTNGADANNPNDSDVPEIAPGQTVTWTYIVTNTGDTPFLTDDVVVTDSHPGISPVLDLSSDTNADGVLSPGEAWKYTATAQAEDLSMPSDDVVVVAGCNRAGTEVPGTRPTYRNIGRVTVPMLTDEDPSHYCNPQNPAIELKKFTNGADADNPNSPDVPVLEPGQTVTWTYIVTNTGDTPFPAASVVVTDSQPEIVPRLDPTSDVNADGILSPGEVWTYRAIGQVEDLQTPTGDIVIVEGCNPTGSQTPGARPTYRNIGRVTVPSLMDEDPSHYCNPLNPAVVLKKYTNGADADDANDPDVPLLAPGQTVTWTYIITNTGDTPFPVASVVVTDSQPGITPVLDTTSDLNADGVLAPGEVWIFVATGQVETLQTPSADVTVVTGCQPVGDLQPAARPAYRNIGRVSVPGDEDEDPSHYCNPPLPGIVIQKLTNGMDADEPNGVDVPQLAPGETVTWTYIVTNTGEIPYIEADVLVTDSQSGIVPQLDASSDAREDRILSPGESWVYTAQGSAENLRFPATNIIVVPGCNLDNTSIPSEQTAYKNIGRVRTPDLEAQDPSHYCNIPPTALGTNDEPATGLLYLPLLTRS